MTWLRVVSRTIREIGPDVYELSLELVAPQAASAAGDLYGVLLMSHGPSDGGLIVWEGEGVPGSPQATVGPISAIVDPARPVKRNYTGWLIDGDGTIDVAFHATTVGVYLGTVTTTWAIRQNGVTVASESVVETYGGLAGSGHSATVTIDDLAVENGDIITATVSASGGSVWFFTIPGGVGDLTERLEITGGSLA